MERGDRPSGERLLSAADRWRLVAASVFLTAITFLQAPAKIVGDTKADLVLAPADFLRRALHLWDPDGSFGQVQNQAYGYLFPMGPFFALGSGAEVPEWIIQRLWWSALLVIAFSGAVLLARELRAGSIGPAIIGGFAYALSPRILTLIGSSSVEVWPMAWAPWVLYAVIRGTRDTRPLRWAALAALAVSAIGGVNAAAAAAVLVLPVLWLLTCPPSRARRTMVFAWPAFTLLGTFWWLGPLLLLGRYSPPFLDFIESASTTTGVATVVDALRGTTNWLPYLDGAMTAGHALVSDPVIILNSLVVVLLGLIGLAWRPAHARFLMVGLLIGLVLVTLGHAGTNIGTQSIQAALDGVLAPVRNTHKFDLVIRIPLVIGLIVFVDRLAASLRASAAPGWLRPAGAILAVAALVGATLPTWSADLARAGSWDVTPQYWAEAAEWLGDNAEDQSTLMLPASAFGDYLWGSPRDEVLQAYASSPWAVRSAVPLTPPGTIRTLDDLSVLLSAGTGGSDVLAALRRAGVRFLLVRSDLAHVDQPDVERVYSTLESTSQITLRAGFGPTVGSPATQQTDAGDTVFVNRGEQSRHRVVEVYEVEGEDGPAARVQRAAETPVLVGASGAVTDATGSVDPQSDVVLAQDLPDGWEAKDIVVTDSFRRREIAFGRVTNNQSATAALRDEPVTDRPVRDYVTGQDARWQAERVDVGGTVSVSSAASDPTESSIDVRAHRGAALDGDARTAWVAGSSDTKRARFGITFEEPTDLEGTKIVLGSAHSGRTVTVRTGDSTTKVEIRPGETKVLPDLGSSTSLELSARSSPFDPFSIAELVIPEHRVSRPLWVPTPKEGWPAPRELNFSTGHESPACYLVEEVTRCRPSGERLSEDGRSIDRVVTMNGPARYFAAVEASILPTAESMASFAGDVKVRTSSRYSAAIQQSPLAMLDGDPDSGWIAGAADGSPRLYVDLPGPTRLTSVRLRTDDSLAASGARRGEIRFDDGSSRRLRFDARGVATFPATTSTRFTLRISSLRARSTLSFDGRGTVLPLGISELSLPASDVSVAAGAGDVIRGRCGTGPTLTIDGVARETALSSSRRAVVAGDDPTVRLCDETAVAWEPGVHRVTVVASARARPTRIRFGTLEPLGTAARTVPLETTRTERRIDAHLAAGSLVSLSQSTNAGWSLDEAVPLTVNGWRQGWWFPSEDPVPVATFGPAGAYRLVLLAGAVGLISLVAMAFALRRGSRGPSPRSRRRDRGALILLAAVVAGLVGGLPGLLGCVIGSVAARTRLKALAVVLPFTVAAGWYYLRPWGSFEGWAGDADWAQWLALVSVGAVAGAVGDRLPRLRRRMAGSSTRR